MPNKNLSWGQKVVPQGDYESTRVRRHAKPRGTFSQLRMYAYICVFLETLFKQRMLKGNSQKIKCIKGTQKFLL